MFEWVSSCAQRSRRQAAQIVVTNVPIASIKLQSEARCRLIRTSFFPFSRLSRQDAINRTGLVHGGLEDLASKYNIALFEQEPLWFGHDSIYIRYQKRKEFFRRIVERLPPSSDARDSTIDETSHNACWNRRPQFAYRMLSGQEKQCQQPSGQLSDGTTVYMY